MSRYSGSIDCNLNIDIRAKYPLAMVSKALEVLGPRWLMAYDIGRSFDGTTRNSSLGPEYE